MSISDLDFDYKINLDEYYYLLKRMNIDSLSLQDPKVLEDVLKRGFRYVKKSDRNFNHILRSPTLGCYLELSVLYDVNSVPIDSKAGRKLINKLCYF